MAKDNISASRATSLLNTHGGPAVLYWAPLGTAFPTKIDDVIQLAGGAGQWAPVSPWASMGITKGGINITRGFDSFKRESDQSWGVYDIRPTAWTAMVSTTLLETSPVNFQIAWVGGAITTVAKVQTTLQIGPAAGVTSLTVNAPGTIASGDYVSIGVGPSQEYAKVTVAAGNVLTLSSATSYAHSSGELILRFAATNMSFGTSRTIQPRVMAVIAPMGADDPAAGGAFNGIRMWAFRRVKLEASSRQIAFSNAADWDLPVSFEVFPDLSIADPETDTFQMFEFGY